MARSDAAAVAYRQYRFSLPPGGTDLLLVRHGESQPARPDLPPPVLDGYADPPLDPQGHKEAEQVAARLAGEHIAAIYVTPLRRTRQTAAPLAARLGLEPQVEAGLREVHLGEWERSGEFLIRMREGHPLARRMLAEQRWDVVPGAETIASLAARVRAGITRIAAAHPDQRVVAFAHGGVIGMAASLATGGRPFEFIGDNASITHLAITDGRWLLRRFNDTGHLDTDLDRPPQPLI